MKIQEFYEKYDIMPQLAEHQLRVGGIGKIITDSLTDRDIARKAVTACLIHDMGNIVKFKGITDSKWKGIQERYIKEYGTEAHDATYGILRKEGFEEYIDYLDQESWLYRETASLEDFKKTNLISVVVLYGDLRVAINGTVSLEERIKDLEVRYGSPRPESEWGEILEDYINSLTKVDVRSITEESVRPLFPELLTYEI